MILGVPCGAFHIFLSMSLLLRRKLAVGASSSEHGPGNRWREKGGGVPPRTTYLENIGIRTIVLGNG